MELKFRNWNEISVNTFKKLQEIQFNQEDELEVLDANVRILALLCDVDEDEIGDLTKSEFQRLLNQTAFLKEMPKAKINDKYVINGNKYNVHLKLQEMSISQYIDFQTFCKEKEKNIAEIIACFLIPKGKKYGDGYNIGDVVNDIGEYMSIVDAYSIMFFFTLLFQSLTKAMLSYSIKQMKKEMKKMSNEEEKQKIREAITSIQAVKNLVNAGVGLDSLK